MKKILKYLAIASLSLVMLFGMHTTVFAAGASLTANTNTVRAGDTITLSLNVSHPGSVGLTGTLEYDANQVTLSGEPSTGLAGWMVEKNGNELVIYDNNLTNPLKGGETVITLTFVVNNNLATGTAINISINNLVSSDGNADSSIGKVTYTTSVARPLSANANLASLSVAGVTLTPGFHPATTTYNLGSVEFNVTKLDITCTTEDPNARYEFRYNYLDVGNNSVYVDVIAENGAKKSYKLTVVRKQNPNYVASSNANLKSLAINQGTVSPRFSENVTDYIVYLPYESISSTFTAEGTKADAKAQGVANGTIQKLVEGINKTTVVCTAEDGTKKNYNITVVVMPRYDGTVPNIGENGGGNSGDIEVPSTETPDTEKPNTEKPSTEEPGTEIWGTEKDSENDMITSTDTNPMLSGIMTVLVVILVIVLVGALGYVLFFQIKR